MFTLNQIHEIHERLGKQATLFQFLLSLDAIGVDKHDSFITDGHSEYYGFDNQKIATPPVHKKFTIAQTINKDRLLKHLSLHNNGETDYLEMSKGLAESGIEKWSFDTKNKTITYFDIEGREVLVEAID